MKPKDEASWTKNKNVIDMAVTFSAMNRVFEKGSKQQIADRLESSFKMLKIADNKNAFENIHSEFCEWFIMNISTAQKTLRNKKIKKVDLRHMGKRQKYSMLL